MYRYWCFIDMKERIVVVLDEGIKLPRANFLIVGLGLLVSSAYQCPM